MLCIVYSFFDSGYQQQRRVDTVGHECYWHQVFLSLGPSDGGSGYHGGAQGGPDSRGIQGGGYQTLCQVR